MQAVFQWSFQLILFKKLVKRPTAALIEIYRYLSLVEVLYGYPLDGVILTTGAIKLLQPLLWLQQQSIYQQ